MAVLSWQRHLIVIGAGMASLLVAEHAIRFAQPELNPNSHIRFLSSTETTPKLGPPRSTFRQIKNTGDFNVFIKFNASGFRDDRNIAEAGPNDFILVGDSYTFGWGVKEPQRISEQLEGLIKRHVFNISIPTAFDGYERLINYAKQRGAKPNRVIIAVSMESDLHLYNLEAKDESTNKMRGAKETKPRGSWLIPIKAYLTQRSALYALATTLVHRTSIIKTTAAKLGILIPNLEGIRKYEFSQDVIEASAQRLKRLADQYKTTVIVIPSRALWHGKFQTIENRRHMAFVKRLHELHLDVLDLRKIFEHSKNPLSLHFKNDPHWLPAGHSIAAKALADHLRRRYGDL